MNVQRTLEQEAEKFLIEYGGDVLALNRKHPEGEDEERSARFYEFERLHKKGVRRIKGLVAEFGNM